jgi:ubiquinone/menaquinone biosynthesis C-methylase UbiE
MDRKAHWEQVYQAKAPTEVSWYRPRLQISLELIQASGIARDGRILDVGGGASTLADDLLDEGYGHVTVLDLSAKALGESRARLGDRAGLVAWIEGDVTQVALPAQGYDLWHDRAVFHFLTEPADRDAYVGAARGSLKPGGHVVIATFGPEGPTRCSGLEVVRYGPDALARAFGEGFRLREARREEHRTPAGKPQQFLYGLLERC